MNELRKWRIYVVGILSLFLIGWAGFASASSWTNPDLLVTPGEVKKNIKKANWVVVDCRSLDDYEIGRAHV